MPGDRKIGQDQRENRPRKQDGSQLPVASESPAGAETTALGNRTMKGGSAKTAGSYKHDFLRDTMEIQLSAFPSHAYAFALWVA